MPVARERGTEAKARIADGALDEARAAMWTVDRQTIPSPEELFLKRVFVRIGSTPCWFSYFQGVYMTIVKVPPQIADLRREVLAVPTL